MVNRNPDVYPCPEKFLPDRWLDMKPNAFSFLTFNAGPRSCVGQGMALLQSKMTIALMMQNFTISKDPSRKVNYDANLTMPIRDGLFVHLTARDNNECN